MGLFKADFTEGVATYCLLRVTEYLQADGTGSLKSVYPGRRINDLTFVPMFVSWNFGWDIFILMGCMRAGPTVVICPTFSFRVRGPIL